MTWRSTIAPPHAIDAARDAGIEARAGPGGVTLTGKSHGDGVAHARQLIAYQPCPPLYTGFLGELGLAHVGSCPAVGGGGDPAVDEPRTNPSPRSIRRLAAADLFALADQARDAGDFATAETAYRALARNPSLDLRSEARFRLALMLADRQHRVRDGAVLLRAILDENPQATTVRLELARLQAGPGDRAGAERQLRAAGTADLSPQVERAIRFFAAGLQTHDKFGASIEAALAPDSNINRATRSETLGTTIGNLTLDQDATARSGVGVSLRGQAHARRTLGADIGLLARISADASLYRRRQYDDVAVQLQLGPEVSAGRNTVLLFAAPAWRWYGGKPIRRRSQRAPPGATPSPMPP